MQLLQFETAGPDNEAYLVEIDMVETSDERAVDIRYTIVREGHLPVIARVYFDTREGVIHLSGLEIAVTGYIPCLIACGLGHIMQEVLQCWRAGRRSPKQLLACLRDKGVDLTPGLVNCSVSCLAAL
jgi:hypothetical protein